MGRLDDRACPVGGGFAVQGRPDVHHHVVDPGPAEVVEEQVARLQGIQADVGERGVLEKLAMSVARCWPGAKRSSTKL